MVEELTSCQARLAGQGGEWGLHRLDTAVFSYYVLRWVHNLEFRYPQRRIGYSNRINETIGIGFVDIHCVHILI